MSESSNSLFIVSAESGEDLPDFRRSEEPSFGNTVGEPSVLPIPAAVSYDHFPLPVIAPEEGIVDIQHLQYIGNGDQCQWHLQ